MPKTSVIIPAHNEEHYIEATLDSYRRQIIEPELIVVANGCTDNTAVIAEGLGARVIELEEAHVSKAKNRGARVATGDFLIFNDADTIAASNYVVEVERALTENIDYGVARAKSDSWRPSAFLYAAMLNGGALILREACGNMFVDHHHFDAVGGFNEKLTRGEDTDLSIKLRQSGAQYTFLWRTSFTPSSRAVSFGRIMNDTFSYGRLMLTGKDEQSSL